jgi:N-acetylglucosamine kinase-like BadF-type ATPase
MTRLFLGVDGGQSHTEAIVADESGAILGRGRGGPSNHAEQPGGRGRLRASVADSVGEALGSAGASLSETVFESAHFGMTGGADYKEEIIGSIVSARLRTVGDDAPTALCGATGGKPGIVVIAGTGSVVYGENASGETARAGGLGYLFSDEGSGFWLAAEAIRAAILEQDGVAERRGFEDLVLGFFNIRGIRDLTTPFYNGLVNRERIAGLAKEIADGAEKGDPVLAGLVGRGARLLVRNVAAVASRVRFESGYAVSGVGGVFRGAVFERGFRTALGENCPGAIWREPEFGPSEGALLLAYRSAKIGLSEQLLSKLKDNKL